MHNLGTVLRFEILRTLKKKSFWIMAIIFPLIIGAVFMIVFFSNQATSEAAQATQTQPFTFAITDESHVIPDASLRALHAQTVSDAATGIEIVRSGKVDAYFYYPSDISSGSVQIYGKDVGIFDNSRYEGLAKNLLQQSAAARVDKDIATILQGNVAFRSTMYKHGAIFDGFKELIAPGIFLVLFYILIAMFGNQMLTSTIEEKENRVIEMILTTIEARTLIIGKIISLIALAMIQIVVILVPVITAYFFLHTQLTLPEIDLSNIPLNPERIAIGAMIFFASFLMFTGLLVAIGAATPTAKEASGFFGIVMTLIFGPLYAVTLFVSSPDVPIVKFLSFFPLTAPIPLMLRNAVGNLTLPEALLGVGILTLSAIIILILAVRIFRYGTLEYNKRLGLNAIFSTHKK